MPRPQYGPTHQRTARDTIAAHISLFGHNCPGLDGVVDAHPSRDLVADHVVAGQPQHGYAVRCRSCNSKRRALGLG